MKKLKKLKLSQLSKDSLDVHKMNRLTGGYCAFGPTNQKANDDEGKCSCDCASFGNDYYSYRNETADWWKYW